LLVLAIFPKLKKAWHIVFFMGFAQIIYFQENAFHNFRHMSLINH
jgi:hypothetical protein